jgi:hypothetical protein
MRRAADLAQTAILSIGLYTTFGQIDPTTVARRFGSWNTAVIAAGLQVANEVNVSDERLFENLMVLWTHFGRQPRRAELARPPSTLSQSPYNRRFGSWTNALNQFVGFANARESVAPDVPEVSSRARTGRDPTLRMRFRVLKRDNFSCCACGATPALTPGLALHVDHVKPWSLGGETFDENLQTLCEPCNLGKSNVL